MSSAENTPGFRERLARNLAEQKPVLDRMAETDRCDGSEHCVNPTHIEGCLSVSSAENGRLVWLDDELFDWIAQYAGSQRPVPTGLLILIGKREASPADPAEAVADALAKLDGYPTAWRDESDIRDALLRDAAAVLAALGVPDASQRRSGGDA